MNFWRTIDVLNKRKWLILFSVVVTTTLTWAATRLVGSHWDASVSFYIPPAQVATANPNDVARESVLDGIMAMTAAKQRAQMYGSIARNSAVLTPAMQKAGILGIPTDQTQRIEFTPSAGAFTSFTSGIPTRWLLRNLPIAWRTSSWPSCSTMRLQSPTRPLPS